MHIGYGFTLLALLVSNVAAFYPIARPASGDPETKGAGPDKRSPLYFYSPEQDGGDKPPTMRIRRGPRYSPGGTPVRRDNAYSIESAIAPTQSNSMALHNDGVDFSYFSTIKVGSTGKELWLLIDTGAAHTWVFGSDCTSSACQSHRTFGSSDSTTLSKSSTPWNVSYGTGSVSGNIITDTMSFAGYKISMAFGSANKATDEFNQFPIDGIIGLGRSSISDPTKASEPTIMDVLASQKLLTANLFGINIWRHSDPIHNGEVNFGAVDTSIIDGDLTWTNAQGSDGLWGIPLDDAYVGDTAVGYKNKRAIIDTGTSAILMPPADAKMLSAKLTGAVVSGDSFQLPCDTQQSISFKFNGVQFNIPAVDLLGDKVGTLCNVNIIGRQTFSSNDWLVGDTFLKNVYAAFDFDKSRIGFGKKKSASSASTTTSTSSSSSTSSASSSQSSSSSSGTSTGTSSAPTSSSSTSSGAVPTGPSSKFLLLSPTASAAGGSSPAGSSSISSIPPTATPTITKAAQQGAASTQAISVVASFVTILVTAIVTVT